MSQTVNVNFKLDSDVKKKYGAGLRRYGIIYECGVYYFCQESRARTTYSV